MLELVFRVCVRQRKKMGAGISGGGPSWAHEAGGAPRGSGRALDPRGQVLASPNVFSVPKILKYSIKIILNLQGIWSTFIFGIFFIARINQETNRKYYFTLFLLNNKKYKEGTKGCASSFIHLVIIKMNPLTRLIKSC